MNVQTFTGSRTHYTVTYMRIDSIKMNIYSNYDTTCMQTFLNTTQVNDLCQQSYATTIEIRKNVFMKHAHKTKFTVSSNI